MDVFLHLILGITIYNVLFENIAYLKALNCAIMRNKTESAPL